MAANLIKAGEDVVVYDTNIDCLSQFKQKAKCVAEVASIADVLITMLPDGKAVDLAYRGSDGIFSDAKKGALFIDCSTVEHSISKTLQKEAGRIGHTMIDSPVSGGK